MIILTLQPCQSDECSEYHSEADCFLSENLSDEEQNGSTEQSLFSVIYCIQFNRLFCKQKLNVFSLMIRSEIAVSLWIQSLGELPADTFLALSCIELPSICRLNLIFNEDFKFSRLTTNILFDHIQNAPNLKILEMNFRQGSLFDMSYEFQKNPVSLVFLPKEGSLVNLERLIISSDFPCLNKNSFEMLERAMICPSKESGSLTSFSLNTKGNTLCDVSYRSVGRILKYNKDQLRSIAIQQEEAIFPPKPAINALGDAFQSMTNLSELSLKLRFQGDDFKNPFIYLDLKELFQGIEQANSLSKNFLQNTKLTFVFIRIAMLNSSELSRCLYQFSDVTLNGVLFSVSTATQLGLALGKSRNLKNLQVTSKRPELGVLLQYALARSKSLKSLSVFYLGKAKGFFRILEETLRQNSQPLEDLSVILSEQNLSLKYIGHVFNGVSEMKNLKKFILTTMSISKGNNEYFSQLFETISKSSSLKSLQVSMRSIPLFQEAGTLIPENIYQPLNNSLKTLELLDLKHATTYSQDKVYSMDSSVLLCCFDFQKQLNNLKILYIRLLRGLLDHPRAYSFSLGSSFQDIEIIETEYKSIVESNIIFIIAFTKAISSNLSFHPNLHIIDLYFS